MPVQAQVGIGAAEALAALSAGAKVPEPPKDSQLRDELCGAVHYRRPREGEDKAIVRHDSREPSNRLGSLGRGVLAVMGLVKHERPGLKATELWKPRGEDVVVHDCDLGAGGQTGRAGR